MINHARTLLLNRDHAKRPPPGWMGEEFVPEDFVPLELPPTVASLHAALFGSSPDDVTLNYRLQQYMTLLHAHRLGDQYVRSLDPRISYRMDTSLVDMNFESSAQLAGAQTTYNAAFGVVFHYSGDSDNAADVLEMTTTGAYAGDAASGQHQRHFHLAIDRDEDTYALRDLTYGGTTTGDLTLSATSPAYQTSIALGDSGVTATTTYDNEAGSLAWDFTLTARPAKTLPQIVTDIKRRSEALDLLLRGGEPYQTFRNLVYRGLSWPDQMCGMLLSLIWRLDELRTA